MCGEYEEMGVMRSGILLVMLLALGFIVTKLGVVCPSSQDQVVAGVTEEGVMEDPGCADGDGIAGE